MCWGVALSPFQHKRKQDLALTTWQQITEDFELLDDWEDRYRYIIELGRALPELDAALRTDAVKVQGCVSQVWLISRAGTDTDTAKPDARPTLHFLGASDAAIVQGLIAILFALYQQKTAEEILEIDAQAKLETLGLAEHLTPQRSNGLSSMIDRIRSDAHALANAA